jgi:phage baseplate assembly protein V
MMAAHLKYGFLDSSDDSSGLRSGTASWLGRENQPIQLASLYGLVHNPPIGCQVLLLPQSGQESNCIGLPDLPASRKKGLASGEVAIVNYLTGSYVLFKQNGDIEVITTAGNLIANIVGNMTATITGNITATATQISLNGVIIDSTGNVALPAGKTLTTSGGGHVVDNGKIMATHQHNETGTVTSAPI